MKTRRRSARREVVTKMWARGDSVDEIVSAVGVSRRTVYRYVQNALPPPIKKKKPEISIDSKLALNVGEVAALIGLSEGHVRRLLKRGDLPYRRFGTRIVVGRKSLEDFLNGSR